MDHLRVADSSVAAKVTKAVVRVRVRVKVAVARARVKAGAKGKAEAKVKAASKVVASWVDHLRGAQARVDLAKA